MERQKREEQEQERQKQIDEENRKKYDNYTISI